jgi:hypothetical protein
MITFKNDKFVNIISFSNRRRIFKLITFLASNWIIPFVLGWILSLVSASLSMIGMFDSMDKSGFSVCVIGGKQ